MNITTLGYRVKRKITSHRNFSGVAKNEGFGRRLESLVSTDESKEEFARSVGLRPHVLSRYFGGQVPKAARLAYIAKQRGVTVEWLLYGDSVAMEERESYSSGLPREVRGLFEAWDRFSPEKREAMDMCRKLLDLGGPDMVEHLRGQFRLLWKGLASDLREKSHGSSAQATSEHPSPA